MSDVDYYKVLGVARNASKDEIQKAYRKQARKFHPDSNPDDKSAKVKFQEVLHAYEVLNDPEKRELYDRYGSSFESMGGGGPGSYGGGPGGVEIDFSQLFGQRGGHAGGFEGGFEDIFRQFGGAPRQQAAPPRRGADLQHQVRVPFTTMVKGGEVQLAVRRGSGKTENIAVKIPPGIEDGKKIRVRGQGEPAARGGQPGDIIITVHVDSHPFFSRRDKNLEVRVPVTLAEAALGATIDVPTPKGTISLKVPAGSSSGKRLRIKGHGIAVSEGTGDLFAQIEIVLPESINDEMSELIRKFDELASIDPRSDLTW